MSEQSNEEKPTAIPIPAVEKEKNSFGKAIDEIPQELRDAFNEWENEPSAVEKDKLDEVWPDIWDACKKAGMKDHHGTGLESVIAFLQAQRKADNNPPLSPNSALVESKPDEKIILGEWQLCPKCKGSGKIFSYDTTNIYNPCDVCGGAKVLARPILNPPPQPLSGITPSSGANSSFNSEK